MRRSAAWFCVFASLGCAQILGLEGYTETKANNTATVGGGGHAGAGGGAGGIGGVGGSPCGAYCALVRADMPLGYWRLGEAPGATEAVDEMNMYPGSYAPGTGTLTLGARSLTHEANTAAAIENGAQGTATIRVDDGPYFPGDTPFTLEVWVLPRDVQYAAMIEKHQLVGQGGGAQEQGYVLTYDSPNLFRFGRIANDDYDTITAPLPMVAEVYHVVGTYDGNDMCLFVNGAQTSACVVSPLQLVPINRPLVMGREMASGVLDDVAVYNYALSEEQIALHYQVGVNGR